MGQNAQPYMVPVAAEIDDSRPAEVLLRFPHEPISGGYRIWYRDILDPRIGVRFSR